ncbi:MAG: hypothetical protein U0T11_00120 [Chitinophagaceae bacterium]
MKKIIPFFLLLSVLYGCSNEAEKQDPEQVIDLADTFARPHITSDTVVKVDTAALKKMPEAVKKQYLKQKRIERNEARMKERQETQ